MKFIRYSKASGSIYIGGSRTKLAIFTHEKCACISWRGKRIVHIGRGWN